jgi:hypothetical protein
MSTERCANSSFASTVQRIAVARTACHRTFLVRTEPLCDVVGVAAMATGLAPGEPLAKHVGLATETTTCVTKSTCSRGNHVEEAEGAAREGLPAVGAAGGLPR